MAQKFNIGGQIEIAFPTAIPAVIIVAVVRAAPTVSLVMFVVVSKQVVKRETVVAGDEID